MLNFLRHKGNADQFDTEIPSHPMMAIIKKTNNKYW
jgi:hypothetical protein